MFRKLSYLLLALAILAGVFAPGTGRADDQSAAVFVTSIPPEYRDWKLISVSHEEGNLPVLARSWATIWR
jgi:hypothetical protein